MNIRDPLTGRIYDVAIDLHEDLVRLHRQRGNAWLSAELRILAEDGRAQLLQQGVQEGALVGRAKTKKPVEVKPEPLEFPLVPETDEDGTKRLYKTRYTILEKRFADLHARNSRNLREVSILEEELHATKKDLSNAEREIMSMQMKTVDSDVILKKITQIANEIKLEMPLMSPYVPLSEKLEAFLGAIFCRVRTIEEDQDELAD